MTPAEWVAAFGLVALLVPIGAAVDHIVDRRRREGRR